MLHESPKSPAAVDALNLERYPVTQENRAERAGAATTGHIRVLGRGVTERTRLWLVAELTARNSYTDTTSVMTCEYDSVLLDAQMPRVVLDFQPQQGDSAP